MHKSLVIWLGLFLAPGIAPMRAHNPHERLVLFALVEGSQPL